MRRRKSLSFGGSVVDDVVDALSVSISGSNGLIGLAEKVKVGLAEKIGTT